MIESAMPNSRLAHMAPPVGEVVALSVTLFISHDGEGCQPFLGSRIKLFHAKRLVHRPIVELATG
jgi:hypothetical protein